MVFKGLSRKQTETLEAKRKNAVNYLKFYIDLV